MTVPKVTTYPTALTSAEWKKEKNVGKGGSEPRSIASFAQAKIKTGLGPALANAEIAWKAIKWDKLNKNKYSDESVEGRLAAVKAARLAAQKYFAAGDVQNAIEKLTIAKTKATAAGKAKLLSKEANLAAKNIATGLETQLTALRSISLTDFDEAVNGFQAYYDTRGDSYREAHTKVSNKLAALSRNLTLDGWDDANLTSNVAEGLSTVKQAIGSGHHAYRPYQLIWQNISGATGEATQLVKGTDTEADKKVIKAYLKDVNAKMLTVQPR